MKHEPEVARRIRLASKGETDRERWSDPAALLSAWDARARRAVDMIPLGARVLDLGCGAMALEGFLSSSCAYIPCDLVSRDERTIVCDFNVGEFPKVDCDIVTALGVFEYMKDPPGFLRALRTYGRPVIMSFTPAGRGPADRRALGWINDLTANDLRPLLLEVGFARAGAYELENGQLLLRLEPTGPRRREEKTVWVVSYENAANFGDRLGLHLLSQVLPAHAVVRHIHHKPFDAPEAGQPDLLILGLGNSLYAPLLTPELIRLVERAPQSIGIFGTQYREVMPSGPLSAILDRLDHWYARYEEDALLYARGRSNVTHLGDWLIDAFPMARPTNDAQLLIDSSFPLDGPLDRTIQKIQQHRQVVSARLHPLLCALTSAEAVGFQEQIARDAWANGNPSGKFRSLFMDVFGTSWAPEGLHRVDRSAVVAYKTGVAERIAGLREDLARRLA